MSNATEQVKPIDQRRERLGDILVVDIDVHLHESEAEKAKYCDMPWRKSLEVIATLPERYLDTPGMSPLNYMPLCPICLDAHNKTSNFSLCSHRNDAKNRTIGISSDFCGRL